MKFNKTNKFKAFLLSGVLSLSLFFGGCSSTVANLGTLNNSTSTEEMNNYSNINDDNKIPQGAEEATIVRVVDGDTMKVKLKDSNEVSTLRLLLIDTPESVKPGVEPQPYSIEASNYAKEVLKEGDKVYIEYDSGDKTDKYDRHLCYLWYYNKKDNKWTMFNEMMVEKGLARVGYIYSQKKHLDLLYAAQDRAKANNLNIWSKKGYVTENGYNVDAYNGDNNKNEMSLNESSSSTGNNSNENNSSEIVYANGGSSTSNKYHSSRNAHGMKGAIKMTKLKAEKEGYVPCGICYK